MAVRRREALAAAAGGETLGGAGERPPRRGAIRRVNFTDRGLFTITGGYDVKGLRRAIYWCWETASKVPGGLVEPYLPTTAEHLLGHATVTCGESRREV